MTDRDDSHPHCRCVKDILQEDSGRGLSIRDSDAHVSFSNSIEDTFIGSSDGTRGNRGVVDKLILEWCHVSRSA